MPRLLLIAALLASPVGGAATQEPAAPGGGQSYTLPDALSESEWRQMEQSVDRGLAWLASAQAADGSFRSPKASGQPAITSLAVMAFLSAGHRPGEGPYGERLDRAIRYALSCQQDDGVYCFVKPRAPYRRREPPHTAVYNHAITGTMLCEVYGMTDPETAALIRASVPKALAFTREQQLRPKVRQEDLGGWRYRVDGAPDQSGLDGDATDSDLSVTAWMLTFFRSARNAEFPVPQKYVDQAVVYVRRCHVGNSSNGVFSYHAGRGYGANHAMTGAGALSLALSGHHDDPMVREAGEWLRRRTIRGYEGIDRFHYAAYYTSQAAAQLGGDCWKEFYPPLVRSIVSGQRPDGSWTSRQTEAEFGEAYLSSMCILALTPSYQLLPIYQR